jgi:prepilin-type N-terminal cleavage/methylation domain-containing protein
MTRPYRGARRGFSVLEVLIAIVIFGIAACRSRA